MQALQLLLKYPEDYESVEQLLHPLNLISDFLPPFSRPYPAQEQYLEIEFECIKFNKSIMQIE